MKVSMIPDNSVKMIHASQDDAGRRWEFELYDEDGLIDVSSVGEQMFYPVYQGGTEQILPENTSTPTTSPLIADIVYPDELRENQEFIYRECPTTEDGNAKIKKVYGNTIKWSQLFDSDTPIVITPTTEPSVFKWADVTIGHKYYIKTQPNAGVWQMYESEERTNTQYTSVNTRKINPNIQDPEVDRIIEITTYKYLIFRSLSIVATANVNWQPMLIDLTALGIGNFTIEQVRNWLATFYPLPYYSFNLGELIPFKGTGIKTTGFNQWDEDWEVGGISISTGNNTSANDRIRSTNYVSILPNLAYYFQIASTSLADMRLFFYDGNKAFISATGYVSRGIFNPPNNARYVRFIVVTANPTYSNDICINISDPSKNGTYKPYKESIVNLPTLTYFPTGMKDVPDGNGGKIYDELSENLASKRVERVDLGTLTYAYDSSRHRFQSTELTGLIKTYGSNEMPTIICSAYEAFAPSQSNIVDKGITAFSDTSNEYVRIIDANYSSAEAFKQAMSGQYLYYELAEPVETPIASASLVSQNQEIPMVVEDDKLVAYSTSEITEQSGFHDAKIKLSNDGVAYSAKFTLHVERKP